MKYFFFLVVTSFVCSCANNKASKTKPAEDLVRNELKSSDYYSSYNVDSTYAIFYTVDSSNYRTNIKYTIYNKEEKDFVRTTTVNNGSLEWHDGRTVKVTEYTGIPRGEAGNKNIYYLDVRTGETTSGQSRAE